MEKVLSSIKGVYSIIDSSTGKIYIGSAYAKTEGIWLRWAQCANVNNLTGGNITFEELKHKSANYIIDNFTYTVLEIFDMKTKKEDIIKREEFLKKVFKTKRYGMNN